MAGSAVTVQANFFNADSVDVRWGSPTGPVVATGQGPQFSVTFNVPSDATAGVHYIVATQAGSRNPATAFKVTAPVSAAPVPEPSSAAPPAPAASSTSEPAATQPSAPTEPIASETHGAPTATASEVPVSGPANSAAPAVRTPVAAATTQGTPGPLAAPSVAAAVQPVAVQPAAASPLAEAAPAPSRRTVADDVWSGFATGGGRSTAPRLDTPITAHDGGSSSAGLLLLAVGFGAFAAGGLALQRRGARLARSYP